MHACVWKKDSPYWAAMMTYAWVDTYICNWHYLITHSILKSSKSFLWLRFSSLPPNKQKKRRNEFFLAHTNHPTYRLRHNQAKTRIKLSRQSYPNQLLIGVWLLSYAKQELICGWSRRWISRITASKILLDVSMGFGLWRFEGFPGNCYLLVLYRLPLFSIFLFSVFVIGFLPILVFRALHCYAISSYSL